MTGLDLDLPHTTCPQLASCRHHTPGRLSPRPSFDQGYHTSCRLCKVASPITRRFSALEPELQHPNWPPPYARHCPSVPLATTLFRSPWYMMILPSIHATTPPEALVDEMLPLERSSHGMAPPVLLHRPAPSPNYLVRGVVYQTLPQGCGPQLLQQSHSRWPLTLHCLRRGLGRRACQPMPLVDDTSTERRPAPSVEQQHTR